MSTILVTGATGTLGRQVVQQLCDRGQAVRAYIRAPDTTLARGVEIFRGDIGDAGALTEASRDVGAIIHCASHFDADNATDLAGARSLVAAAHANQVPHLVYISIVGIDHSNFSYFQGKRQVETIIEQSGLPFSILRTTQFHDFVLNMIVASGDEKTATIRLPRGLRFQSIDTPEVAEALVDLAFQRPVGRALDMGGPEILTLDDMARSFTRLLDRAQTIETAEEQNGEDFHEDCRTGLNLAPDRAVGHTTWEEFLRQRA